MGSGNYLKAIIGSKKGNQTSSKSEKGLSTAVKSKASKKNGTHSSSLVVRSEDWAATRIQTAFKAYKIKARRVGMVMEGRLMHKRLENQ